MTLEIRLTDRSRGRGEPLHVSRYIDTDDIEKYEEGAEKYLGHIYDILKRQMDSYKKNLDYYDN